MKLNETYESVSVKMRTNVFKTVLLFCVIVYSVVYNSAHAQNTYGDMINDAKLKKSPAKDIIPKAEKLSENLSYKAQNPSSQLSFESEKKAFIANYDTLIFLKAEIVRLDPKWKTKKIDESLAICKPTYDKLLSDKVKFNENRKEFDRYGLFFNDVKDKFWEASKNGELLSFVKGEGKFIHSWEEIMAKADSALIVQDYVSKNNQFKSKEYITGLDFFKGGESPGYISVYKNLLLNINKLSAYQELSSKATGEERFNQFNTLNQTLNSLEAYLLIEPNNAELKAAQTKVQSLHNNSEKVFDRIVTSPFHKANLNKVFLSDHQITLGTESEKDFRTSFKGGETIYVTYYLTEKREATNARAEQIFNSQDGLASTVTFFPIIDKNGKDSVSVVQYALVPAAGSVDDIKLSRLIEAVEKLNDQKETKAFYWLKVSKDAEIKFDVTINATENYKQTLSTVRKAKANIVNLPKTGMTDAQVSATVKKQIEGMTDEGYTDITVVRVIIQAKEWNVYTYKNTDVIKNRTLLEVFAICKDSKGNCFIMPGDFTQKREGGVYNTGYFEFSNSYYGTADGNRVGIDEDDRIYFNCSKL